MPDKYDKKTVDALAEAILLKSNALPPEIETELSTLRRMLETAVCEGIETDAPVPPAYEKTITVTLEEKELRQDVAKAFPDALIALSARRVVRASGEEYVTVPQVVAQHTVSPENAVPKEKEERHA